MTSVGSMTDPEASPRTMSRTRAVREVPWQPSARYSSSGSLLVAMSRTSQSAWGRVAESCRALLALALLSGLAVGGSSGLHIQQSPADEDAQVVAARVSRDATIIAAVLGLVGVALTSVVAVIGYRFKRAYDSRSQSIQENEQARLELDTIVNALGLLSTANGAEVSSTQRTGALVVLAELSRMRFALSLMRTLWIDNKITTNSAIMILDLALRADDPLSKAEAAELLLLNRTRLLHKHDSGYDWPPCIDGKWNLQADVHVRETLLLALMQLVVERKSEDWGVTWLSAPLVDFRQICLRDPDGSVSCAAGRAGRLVAGVLHRTRPEGHVVEVDVGVRRSLEQIEQELATAEESSVQKLGRAVDPSDRVAQGLHALKTWADSKEAAPKRPE